LHRSPHDALSDGHHLSHIGRFALTLLVNVGMPTDAVLDLYRNASDFERLTRFQVEHMTGERGSRTKYKPLRCETLRRTASVSTQTKLQKRNKTPNVLQPETRA